MKKTSKNFLLNIIYQLFTFIIPLITIPYISRVLGAEKIGIYSYTYSIVYYFMLASMLGINNYGAREIAKLTDKNDLMSKRFWEIYFLQLIMTFIMIILYFSMIFIIKFEYKFIMIIQGIYLLSCGIDINWLFFGLEKFKITISRNIIIKIVSLIFIFIFVKNQNDLYLYTIIMSSATFISQLYLWLYIKKNIKVEKVALFDIFSHFKQCLILFIPVIAYSIYRVMDKTMIGLFSNVIELGYYENAEKIINIPMTLVSALGTVMMPHMSKTKDDEFENNIIYSFKLCFFFLIPICFGLLIVAEDFSTLFFGNEFVKSSIIIRALVPTIIFGGVTNIIRTNYLIPKCKDKIYITSTILGAIINLILNIMFIRKFGSIGACIGTIFTELVIMLYQVINTRKNINYKNIFLQLFSFIFSALIMSVSIIFIGYFIKNLILKFIVQISISIVIYFILTYKYILFDFLGIKEKKKIHASY